MSSFRWVFLTQALALLLGSGGNALSEVYRWKDSNGVVHFGDQPVSTNPERVKQVIVPGPNLAKAFEAKTNTPVADPAVPDMEGETDVPANPLGAVGSAQNPASRLSGAARSKDSCQAKVAAYKASKACFDSCGRPNGNMNGRNNAGCEHCVDQPMPNC
jgi:hypothetical protein